jgi:ABC-type bacteriocin/lantibiotic exporter with double-glycine peptidase domain
MLAFYGGMYALFFDSVYSRKYAMAFFAVGYLSLGLILNNLVSANGYATVSMLTVKMKGTLFYTLSRHILGMDSAVLRPELQGNIVSIVTEFQYLMEESAYTTFRALTAPIAIVGLGWLLVARHGWLTLIGIGLCMAFEVVHVMLANRNSQYLVKSNELKDRRNHALSELVLSLKYIKMQMWEAILLKEVRRIRKEEI